MKKFFIAVAILFVVGIVLIISLTTYFGRDIPVPDVSDLAVTQSVKPEDTAYTFFLSANDVLYLPSDPNIVKDYINDKPVDSQIIAEVIAKNEKTLDLINRGVECESCMTPEVVTLDASLSYLSPWHKISMVLAAKTKSERLLGNKDATDTFITLIKFGNLIQKDAGTTIQYILGVSIMSAALEQAQNLVYDDMPREELERLSKTIESLDSPATGLVRAFKYEYKTMDRTVDDLRNGKLILFEEIPLFLQKHMPRYLLQPNRTKLIFADLCRNYIKNTHLYYTDININYPVCIYPSVKSVVSAMNKPNSVGKMLFYILPPASNKLIKLKCQIESDIIATNLIVNIHTYKKDNGAFPKNLQDLVPKYIDAVPVDPFDGKPFRYKPDKDIIYSVGEDCIDSGGSTAKLPKYECKSGKPNRWHLEDAVYEIEKKTESSSQEGAKVQDATN